MRLLGASRLGMTLADDSEILVVDLAACTVVVTALSRLGLSAAALKAMRIKDACAYELLQDAAEAYGRSSALRDELGGPGSAAFPHLRAVLANAA
ncbi:hypothetical protein FHG71_18330 [Rubellimicrobium roseum]|uniref:Uncharacterized protein n=2 Tax=Rubellimicrobium roseum TaxID=687525 RepID=A0A5C4N9W5_9RHOB|nr:hypothetical protein FHG71_18330 [Rubellimicrobium roseum]